MVTTVEGPCNTVNHHAADAYQDTHRKFGVPINVPFGVHIIDIRGGYFTYEGNYRTAHYPDNFDMEVILLTNKGYIHKDFNLKMISEGEATKYSEFSSINILVGVYATSVYELMHVDDTPSEGE